MLYVALQASHAPTCNPFPKRVVKPDDGCRSFFDHDPANTHGLGNATIAGFKAYISTLLNHKNQVRVATVHGQRVGALQRHGCSLDVRVLVLMHVLWPLFCSSVVHRKLAEG